MKAESRLRSSLKSLQQSIDIIELDFGTEALTSAAAQFIQDITGFLQSVLIGDFNVALIISAVVRHRAAERIALDLVTLLSVGRTDLVLVRVAPLALHAPLHLLREIARRLLQLIERFRPEIELDYIDRLLKRF